MDSVFYSETFDWRISPISSGKPFSVWQAPKSTWYCVVDQVGTNILTRGTGHVFTSKEIAEDLARKWNG